MEKLTISLKNLKEEKAVLERKLKEAQERAGEAEEKQKEMKILIAEEAALRKDAMVLAADMHKESKVHAEQHLGMDQDPLIKITQKGQMASGEQR